MPLISNSPYRPPAPFRNAHVNTIYPALVRQVEGVHYQRERIKTPDDDFLDLDWSCVGGNRLLIALHGLEGHSNRSYIRGMIRRFNREGWDGLGMNFRGCSGEPNRQLRSYHMGETSDLNLVIHHVLETGRYREIALVGFSLGGNVILKYLGEGKHNIPDVIVKAVAFSVPCHIPSANISINHWQNFLYMRRFMQTLNEKAREKASRFPEVFHMEFLPARNFLDFDDHFTASAHGFRDAADYWTSCSSLQFLPGINRQVLLIQAADDTFLSPACFPHAEAQQMSNFFLEIPKWGGHVGFFMPGQTFWSEKRAWEFIGA